MLIKSKGQKNIHKDLILQMETGNIKQLEVVKVLGVYISRDELFKEYLVNSNNSMMRFLETRLNMLRLLSRYADLKSRKALAEGLILSKINYCILLWGTTLVSIFKKLQVFLNKVMRVVLKVRKNARIIENFQKLRMVYCLHSIKCDWGDWL